MGKEHKAAGSAKFVAGNIESGLKLMQVGMGLRL